MAHQWSCRLTSQLDRSMRLSGVKPPKTTHKTVIFRSLRSLHWTISFNVNNKIVASSLDFCPLWSVFTLFDGANCFWLLCSAMLVMSREVVPWGVCNGPPQLFVQWFAQWPIMVEMTGFEPVTPCLQSRCYTTKLHPQAILLIKVARFFYNASFFLRGGVPFSSVCLCL